MYRDSIMEIVRERRILHSVMLELTYRCNLDCFYCYNEKDASGQPLTFEQYVALLEDLARMQTLFLTFTGGEPMVHPRFFDLGMVARELGFALQVRTNGHTLTPKIARRLQVELDPYLVEMSLHGASAKTHDRQTRVPGSFDQLIANIRGMKELGIRQKLVCTPTAWNEHELAQIFDLADSLGIEIRWQGPVIPRDDGDTEPMDITPSSSAWQTILMLGKEHLARVAPDPNLSVGKVSALEYDLGCMDASPVANNQERVCAIGTMAVDIDPFGNVYPCMHIKRSAGSLHEQGIEQIWHGATGRKILAEAEQLSLDAARRFEGKPLEQFGAPLFCPAVEVNIDKGRNKSGCSSGCCACGQQLMPACKVD